MADIIVISSEGEHRASVKRSRDEFILAASSPEQDFEDEPEEEKIECSPYKRRCLTPPTQSSLGDDVIVEDSQPFGDIPRDQHSAHSQAKREREQEEEDLPMHQPEEEEEEEKQQQQPVAVIYNGFTGEHGQRYQSRSREPQQQYGSTPMSELSAVCPSNVHPLVWARYLTVHSLTAFFEKAESAIDSIVELVCGLHAFDPETERLSNDQGCNFALAPVFHISNSDLQRLKTLGSGYLRTAVKDFWNNWANASVILGGEMVRYQTPGSSPEFVEDYSLLLKQCGKTIHRLKLSISALDVAAKKHDNLVESSGGYVFYAHSSFGHEAMNQLRLSIQRAVSYAGVTKMRWCGPVAGCEKADFWISDMIPELTFQQHIQHGGLMFAELREARESISRVWDTFVRSNGRMFVIPKQQQQQQ